MQYSPVLGSRQCLGWLQQRWHFSTGSTDSSVALQAHFREQTRAGWWLWNRRGGTLGAGWCQVSRKMEGATCAESEHGHLGEGKPRVGCELRVCGGRKVWNWKTTSPSSLLAGWSCWNPVISTRAPTHSYWWCHGPPVLEKGQVDIDLEPMAQDWRKVRRSMGRQKLGLGKHLRGPPNLTSCVRFWAL
jgi:hypothetical protein